MPQMINDANDVAETTAPTTKVAWTAPTIETYDVAEFTLTGNGNNPGDGIQNQS